MTIDEEIEMFNKKSEEYNEDFESCKERVLYTCRGCANCFPKTCDELEKEYKQLAEWLEELKDYRDKNKMVVRVDCENMDSIKDKIEELSRYAENQYNKAIDDLMKKVSECFISNADWNYLVQEAKQLKAGGKDEQKRQNN